MQLNPGDFIRWSDRDDQGAYHWIGRVVQVKDGMVKFENSVGSIFGIPEDDGTFAKIRKPINWDKERASVKTNIPKKAKTTSTSIQKPKTKKKTRSSGISKIDQVVALLTENPDLINSRKTAIERIVNDIGMTPAGASTYFSNAKKKVVLGG